MQKYALSHNVLPSHNAYNAYTITSIVYSDGSTGSLGTYGYDDTTVEGFSEGATQSEIKTPRKILPNIQFE